MVSYPHSIPGGEQLEVQRFPAMGLDLPERQARCSPNHPPAVRKLSQIQGFYDNREGNLHGCAKAMGERVGTAKSDDGQIALRLDRPVEMGGKGNGIRIPENVVGDLAVSFWPFKKDKRKDSHCGRYADPSAGDRTSHCRGTGASRPSSGHVFPVQRGAISTYYYCRLEAEWRHHEPTPGALTL